RSSDALNGMANVYTRGQRFADAEPILEKITAMHPDDVSARLQLGRVLLILGKSDDAIAALQAAQKLDPGDRNVQQDLGDLYIQTKKYEQAETLYRSMVAADPDNARLH